MVTHSVWVLMRSLIFFTPVYTAGSLQWLLHSVCLSVLDCCTFGVDGDSPIAVDDLFDACPRHFYLDSAHGRLVGSMFLTHSALWESFSFFHLHARLASTSICAGFRLPLDAIIAHCFWDWRGFSSCDVSSTCPVSWPWFRLDSRLAIPVYQPLLRGAILTINCIGWLRPLCRSFKSPRG